MGNNSAMAFSDSEDLVNDAEYKGDEDYEVSGELARLLQQEERTILPHEELLETINLGKEEDIKEVRVGSVVPQNFPSHFIKISPHKTL